MKYSIFTLAILFFINMFAGTSLACHLTPPTLAINPGYQFAKRGETAKIIVYVFNHDSTDCGSTIFHLTAKDLDQGSEVKFENPDQLIDPGAMSVAHLNVTVGEEAAFGQHMIRVESTDDLGNPDHEKFTTAIVHVNEK